MRHILLSLAEHIKIVSDSHIDGEGHIDGVDAGEGFAIRSRAPELAVAEVESPFQVLAAGAEEKLWFKQRHRRGVAGDLLRLALGGGATVNEVRDDATALHPHPDVDMAFGDARPAKFDLCVRQMIEGVELATGVFILPLVAAQAVADEAFQNRMVPCLESPHGRLSVGTLVAIPIDMPLNRQPVGGAVGGCCAHIRIAQRCRKTDAAIHLKLAFLMDERHLGHLRTIGDAGAHQGGEQQDNGNCKAFFF